ncbi:MAG: hypothetical protein ACMUEL_06435 [Flavobacteriales bacterium Tduv]
MFLIFEIRNKKFILILRNTEQISFSKLYMKRSSRRSEFFKRLKMRTLYGIRRLKYL